MAAPQVTYRRGYPLARRMKPTLKHRLAVYPGLLGTVYAVSPGGQHSYFDYDWDAAKRWAGIDGRKDQDLRVARADRHPAVTGPARGALCLYMLRGSEQLGTEPCETCHGAGTVDAPNSVPPRRRCRTCGGSGKGPRGPRPVPALRKRRLATVDPCEACNGNGWPSGRRCRTCGGTGKGPRNG